MVGWLYFTSHRRRGHLETAPPFTDPCEGREARFSHRSHRESNTGQSLGSPLHYRCATPAPLNMSVLTLSNRSSDMNGLGAALQSAPAWKYSLHNRRKDLYSK